MICDVLLCMAMYGYVWLYNVVYTYTPTRNIHKPWLNKLSVNSAILENLTL